MLRVFREDRSMDLIKCPRCGEMYSSSYRRCPFCEEEDYPRKASSRRGGHHVSEKKHTHSARGSMAAVLIVVLVVLSWYLFGGKLVEKFSKDPAQPSEDVTPVTDDKTQEQDGTDATTDEPGTEPDAEDPDTPAPPSVEKPDATDTPVVPAAVDVSALGIKTNVGTTLKRAQDSGAFDVTIGLNDAIRLIIQGTDVQPVWSSSDTSVLTVGTDGALKPLKAGTATVTADFSGAKLECIVRVK